MPRHAARFLVAALLFTSIAFAKGHRTRLKEDDLLTGKTVSKNVATVLNSITWYKDLDQAKAEAKRLHRAIFWLHALGDLGGST